VNDYIHYTKQIIIDNQLIGIKFRFNEIKLNAIIGFIQLEITYSRKELRNAGLKYIENFEVDYLF